MNKSLPSHLGCIIVCFIPVETLVVCKATSHIECHRHLAAADTERESLYPTIPAKPCYSTS